ncbi:MAG: hypothetical protein ACK452_03325, partial [Bacteroidota bacterium]
MNLSKSNRKSKLSTTILFFTIIFSARYYLAQEYNYWSNNFGAKSTLMCGAAVSNYFDNGAIFYNPATLCFKASGNISLSANLYKFESLKRIDALGQGLSVNSTNFNFSPQIVSGNKKIGKKLEIEFILMSKSDIQFNQSFSFNKYYNDTLIFSAPRSLYVASYNMRKRILDEWGGLSMSFNLTDKIGIGFGSFVSSRMSRYQMNISANNISTDTIFPAVSKSDSALTINKNDINVILKGGLVYNGYKNNFGFTVTASSIPVWGRGDLEYSIFISDPYTTGFIPIDVYVRRTNTKTQYKYPWSFALGYTRKYKRSKLHLTTEIFGAVAPYYMLKVQNVTSSTGSGNVSLGGDYLNGFKDAKRTIANFAVGYEKVLKGTLELLLGCSTDFSNNDYYSNISNHDYNLNQESFNIFHYSIGFGFQHNKNNIAIGLAGSSGSRYSMSIANFQDPTFISKYFGFNYNSSLVK